MGQLGTWLPVTGDQVPRLDDRWVELDGRHDRRWLPGDPRPADAKQGGAVLMRRIGKGRRGGCWMGACGISSLPHLVPSGR